MSAGYVGSIPGSGRFLIGGNGNPLQYSCLKNSMDRGAWSQKWLSTHQCTISRVLKCQEECEIHLFFSFSPRLMWPENILLEAMKQQIPFSYSPPLELPPREEERQRGGRAWNAPRWVRSWSRSAPGIGCSQPSCLRAASVSIFPFTNRLRGVKQISPSARAAKLQKQGVKCRSKSQRPCSFQKVILLLPRGEKYQRGERRVDLVNLSG